MRITLQTTALGLLALAIAACGSPSSTGPTNIPTTATIFYAHALAFRNNTTLAWGYNGFGQLGNGSLANSAAPTPVPGLTGVQRFAIGADHSVVFDHATSVRTWGFNNKGQLGVKTDTVTVGNLPTSFSSSPVKVSIPNVSAANPVKSVAAGGLHTLALLQDGTVWAWGSNDFGQLGDSATFPAGLSASPVLVFRDTLGGTRLPMITEIAAGSGHSLALDLDGVVWAWGNNATGQLGANQTTIFASTKTTATFEPLNVAGFPATVLINGVSTPARVSAVAAAGSFNLALLNDGTVWAWGYNGFGQLGNNSLNETTANISFTPVPVVKTDGNPLANVTRIAAGLDHGLALDANGNIWAWGFNNQGQLGINSKLDSLVAVRVVADAANNPFTGATEIFAAGNYSQAKVGNVLFAWGENSFGQLGINPTVIMPNALFPQRVSGF